MTCTKHQIIQSLLQVIAHISDKEYQKRAWIKGEAGDFDESVIVFFDIMEILSTKKNEINISDDFLKILIEFSSEFKKFSDENDLPQLFIDTPEWTRITEMAQEVLDLFDYKKPV